MLYHADTSLCKDLVAELVILAKKQELTLERLTTTKRDIGRILHELEAQNRTIMIVALINSLALVLRTIMIDPNQNEETNLLVASSYHFKKIPFVNLLRSCCIRHL